MVYTIITTYWLLVASFDAEDFKIIEKFKTEKQCEKYIQNKTTNDSDTHLGCVRVTETKTYKIKEN